MTIAEQIDIYGMPLDGTSHPSALGCPASKHPQYKKAAKLLAKEKDDATLCAMLRWSDVFAVLAGCRYSAELAAWPILFAECNCVYDKGPLRGQLVRLLPFQKDILSNLFGWIREDGTRRFRRAFIELPKKNGKSFLCSIIALILAGADGEGGAEVYCAAKDREQSKLVMGTAMNMVKLSPNLQKMFTIIRSTHRILHEQSGSILKAISADAGSNEGMNIHGLIFDELHVQKNPAFFRALMYGGASRTQPMQVIITTSGHDRASLCYQEHERAMSIMSGTDQSEDWSRFAYVSAAELDGDWADPKQHRRANPGLGITIQLDQFQEDVMSATQSPSEQNGFKRYRMNIWTEQSDLWCDMALFDQCDEAQDATALANRLCYAGMDLSATQDLSAVAYAFPPLEPGGEWDWVVRTFCPEQSLLSRAQKWGVPLDLWAEQGWLLTTPGNYIDYRAIRAQINTDREKYLIHQLGYDEKFARHIAIELTEEDGIECVPLHQGAAKMTLPMMEVLKLFGERRIIHGNNPLVRWAFSHMAAKTFPDGGVRPDKDGSGGKIDPGVAIFMAMERALVNLEPDDGRSVYEDEGLLII